MKTTSPTTRVIALGLLASSVPALLAAPPVPIDQQQARLVAHAVLPAATARPGSPSSGAFLSPQERAVARANGVLGPAVGPYFAAQPVQGFSSMVPAPGGAWWVLADNGYAWRPNSADWQLVIYRIDPRWGEPGGPALLGTLLLRDPDRRIPWTIVCDPRHGRRLPDFSFNALPEPPPACGTDAAARLLTGFDLDPESFVLAPDGSFWVSDEFGPFLLHFAADGRLLAPPVELPGVRSPQNPFLDRSDPSRPERPTVAASRGFEGLAISPDGGTLFALLEGSVAGDDAQDLRLCIYRVAADRFADAVVRYRLEARAQEVDLSALVDGHGELVYPGTVAPPPGAVSIGELKALDERRLLVIERDNLGDDERTPRFKKLFLVDLAGTGERGGYVAKAPLLDLLALPDPDAVGGDGDFFRLPFYTIESVHPVDEHTLLIASDNNFPGSNGRARSRSRDRSGPLAADDTEIVLVRLGEPLSVDRRLLPLPRSGRSVPDRSARERGSPIPP